MIFVRATFYYQMNSITNEEYEYDNSNDMHTIYRLHKHMPNNFVF